jgi:hypothetical protein
MSNYKIKFNLQFFVLPYDRNLDSNFDTCHAHNEFYKYEDKATLFSYPHFVFSFFLF